MPKNISKELEVAILSLTQKEKDRHLLRLIAKNELLREQLQFTLLEDEADLYLRKEKIKEHIQETLSKSYSSVTFFLRDLRKLSTTITWHRRVTKDKYGEIDLFILALRLALENQRKHISSFSRKGDVCRVYIVKKTLSVLKMIDALHEDFKIDFKGRMNQILTLLHTFETKYDAQKLSLPQSIQDE
ncbi:MAG: hypothetical protein NXI00_17495 [Cytophagales bacterium]|nr:hypothetical protein [Cytophagales bacterium]